MIKPSQNAISGWVAGLKAKVSRRPGPGRTLPDGISADLGRILRPQAAYRWLLPQLAAITPQYIEMTLRGALAGNHVQAWELFDLMEDTWPELNKSANELKNATVQELKRWKCRAYQEEGESVAESAKEKAGLVHAALTQMQPDACADENDFAGTIYDLCDAWLKGQVVLETDWHVRLSGKYGEIAAPRSTFWVHPVCYAWSMEGRLGLRVELAASRRALSREGGESVLSPGVWNSTSYQPRPSAVEEFPADKFLIGIAKAKSGVALGASRLRCLAWWWCAANFSADWLLNLAQLFGLPFRWGNYDPNAPQKTIDSICAMLENMGSAGWAAFPAGTTLELKDTGKTGDQSPQGDLLDRADTYCVKLILGQTLTTDVGNSGSRALGDVHAGVKHEIIEAVCGYVSSVLNTQLIPSIMRLNYGDLEEMPQYEADQEEEGTLEFKREVLKQWSQHAVVSAVLANLTDLKQLVRDAGMPVNEEYKDPYVPVRDQSGGLVTGETLKDAEGDIVGGVAQTPEVRSPKSEVRSPEGSPKVEGPNGNNGNDGNDGGDDLPRKGAEDAKGEDTMKGKRAEGDGDLVSNGQELVVEAIAAEFAGINKRLAAIAEIQDGETQRRKLAVVMEDLKQFERDLAKDPMIAQAIYKVLAAGLANGMAGVKRET